MSQVTKHTVDNSQELLPIKVFYPRSNKTEAALLDVKLNKAIGLNDEGMMHLVGGYGAMHNIAYGSEDPKFEKGFVLGSPFFGYPVRHCYGNTYTPINS